MRHGAALLAALLTACGAAATCPGTPDVAASVDVERHRQLISETLDAWHRAAASADEEAYFGAFSDDAVFMGTDATERWTLPEFRAFAHPYFERGSAWAFRAIRRVIEIDEGGDFAWFDEDLETQNLGPARGSGVLRRVGPGEWRIVHYNLAITIPNERFDAVRELLTSPPG